MNGDAWPGHQRHVFDQQREHALAFQRTGSGVVPDAREVARQVDDSLARRLVELSLILVLLAFVLLLQGVEFAQALVPIGLERIGHQAVVRIHLGVAATGQLGLVARALQLRLAPRGGLLDALRDLVLHGQRDLDCRRRHGLQQQRANRRVDRRTVDRLARSAGSAHDLFVAAVVRPQLSTERLVVHPHARTALAAQHATLQQAVALAGHPAPLARREAQVLT